MIEIYFFSSWVKFPVKILSGASTVPSNKSNQTALVKPLRMASDSIQEKSVFWDIREATVVLESSNIFEIAVWNWENSSAVGVHSAWYVWSDERLWYKERMYTQTTAQKLRQQSPVYGRLY